MKGDFSRSTFRTGNHYSGVRLQQGRVLLDAEWNEQVDIWSHLQRTAITDVVGPTGAPAHAPGEHVHFAVALAAEDGDLALGSGHYYVDGLLCETEGTSFLTQPDFPGAALPGAAGAYALVLDVWERHVTPVEQRPTDFPSLREVALGGPDTSTRTQVVWQARLFPIETASCDAFIAPANSTGRLRARAVPAEDPGSDCLVPEAGGYRRLENQLYRVEVDEVVEGGVRVTWSRDNASVVSRVRDVDQVASVIVVEDEDRDESHGFATATFVELSDDERWRRNERGVVLPVDSVSGTAITVANPENMTLAAGTHATLRRWDGSITLTPGTPVELEDGVEVEIDGGTLAPGDHWVIAARTLTGTVEWPTDASDPPVPLLEPSHAAPHHHAVLAVVDFDGDVFAELVDCRPQFPPLTSFVTLHAVSGDGQTVPSAPNTAVRVALPEPIVVAATNGSLPVPGARVRFTVTNGAGAVNSSTSTVIVTDATGQAAAAWEVDSATGVQQVRAELLDSAGSPFAVPVGFTASLLSASRTTYAPSAACPDLAGATSVQEAIDQLCQRGGRDDLPRIRGMSWEHVGVLTVGEFLEGLQVFFDRPMTPPDGSPHGWFLVSIEYDRREFEADPTEIFVRRINASDVEFVDDDTAVIFRPFDSFVNWANQTGVSDEVLCRVVLKCHVLADRERRVLDGDFLRADLPSGDGTPGGDFESWFTLRMREG